MSRDSDEWPGKQSGGIGGAYRGCTAWPNGAAGDAAPTFHSASSPASGNSTWLLGAAAADLATTRAAPTLTQP